MRSSWSPRTATTQRTDPDSRGVDDEFHRFAVEQLDEADALLSGRKTFEAMAPYWTSAAAADRDPEILGRMNGYQAGRVGHPSGHDAEHDPLG